MSNVLSEVKACVVNFNQELAKGNLQDIIEARGLGICFNLSKFILNNIGAESRRVVACNVGYKIVRQSSLGWAYHTGDVDYPVPQQPNIYFDDLWKGEQLEYRRDLMGYIVENLDKVIDVQ